MGDLALRLIYLIRPAIACSWIQVSSNCNALILILLLAARAYARAALGGCSAEERSVFRHLGGVNAVLGGMRYAFPPYGMRR